MAVTLRQHSRDNHNTHTQTAPPQGGGGCRLVQTVRHGDRGCAEQPQPAAPGLPAAGIQRRDRHGEVCSVSVVSVEFEFGLG